MTNSISQSHEMRDLISLRGETPDLVGTHDDGTELYCFQDGTEIMLTNAGVVTDDADGFAELRAEILR